MGISKAVLLFTAFCSLPAAATEAPANPAIDMEGYLRVSAEAARTAASAACPKPSSCA